MIKSSSVENSRVKFIDYTGRYPNLCSGVLTLEIDGKIYKFGYEEKYGFEHMSCIFLFFFRMEKAGRICKRI